MPLMSMDRRRRGSGRFPVKNLHVDNLIFRVTWFPILVAPPKGVSYRIRRIFCYNGSGGTNSVELGVQIGVAAAPQFKVWRTANRITGVPISHVLGGQPVYDMDIILEGTDVDADKQTLMYKQTNAGTLDIDITYEVMESA